ncbi:MAG: preprotein translocase subunit SecE [Chloroflexi bacterium]|nr:preprotein translocase subunit SecE [Chloroflexota bacterium]
MRGIPRVLRREPQASEPAAAKAPVAKAARRTPPTAQRPTVRFQFFREVAGELRKVTWPSREDVVRLTVLVSAMAVAVGGILGALDYIFTEAVRILLSLGR